MIKPIRATGLERLELQRLRDRVGRLFAALQEATEAENPLASGAWAPPVDLLETQEAITLRVELPGVSADQIKIGLCNTKLRIWGEKKRRPARRRIISYLCSERSYGNFSRVVPLRWTLDVRAAEAELEKGVLHIRLPKLDDRRGGEFIVAVKDLGKESAP
ncbi:MAG TPA: Hsp20/alpha crystallin family protein [Pyrinomonadaceae bacterium]|jgi:HSP20 family protein|nr:Hsp20/alpha crystallin family protein [Pyrinomonadaceae bacterium]